MALFPILLDQILGHNPSVSAPSTPATPVGDQGEEGSSTQPTTTPTTPAPDAPAPVITTAPVTAAQSVDVASILDDLARANSGGLDWRRSITDLLKLTGIEHNPNALRSFASELGYDGDLTDEPALHDWLHRAVIEKLGLGVGK